MIDGKALETWFKGRPKWLQDAARRLLQNDKLIDNDIRELTVLCKHEAGIDVTPATEAKGIPEGTLTHSDISLELRLNAISDVHGINALAPRKPLKFENSNLTIIYGPNGSGKSGYVRILKHACGARHIGRIHSDISKAPPTSQGCKFIYTLNGDIKELQWTVLHGVHPELHPIEVYDTHSGEVYINETNEVAFEPRLLAFFRALVEGCDVIARVLNTEVQLNPSGKPRLPSQFARTESEKWYQRLSYSISKKEIEKWCTWSETDEDGLVQLKKRLSEPDPSSKAATLRRQKTNLESLIFKLRQTIKQLSPEMCNTFVVACKDAQTKRQAADVDAKKVFHDVSLTGVGSESWKLLWEHARTFSETMAYRGTIFPNTGEDARCVLCHQVLTEDAKTRLKSFESFIKDALEQEAKLAENLVNDLKEGLPVIPSADEITVYLDSTGLIQGKDWNDVITLRTALEKRKTDLLAGRDIEAFQQIFDQGAIDQLQCFAVALERDAKNCDADAAAVNSNRTELQLHANEIEAKKWLSQQKAAIETEVERLQRIAALERAKALTSTLALTKKKVELSEDFVTAEYIKRFETECKELKASHIGIEIAQAKGEKGRVLHEVRFKNNITTVPTGEILSEGELRIISLAAFLADAEGRKDKTPIIFDDPISSLDQDYEEAMVRRLVKLCKNRQVIVFTHRISLLVLLKDAAEKERLDPDIKALEREPWSAGELGDTPFEAQKPKQAITTLLTDIEKARKIRDTDGTANYNIHAQDICSKFRKTLERIIEDDLLDSVIQRFRRSVKTRNRLDKLSKISIDDTKLLDDMMTRYSTYEHSQPIEAPVRLPDPDELKRDIEALKTWRELFGARSVG